MHPLIDSILAFLAELLFASANFCRYLKTPRRLAAEADGNRLAIPDESTNAHPLRTTFASPVQARLERMVFVGSLPSAHGVEANRGGHTHA